MPQGSSPYDRQRNTYRVLSVVPQYAKEPSDTHLERTV